MEVRRECSILLLDFIKVIFTIVKAEANCGGTKIEDHFNNKSRSREAAQYYTEILQR